MQTWNYNFINVSICCGFLHANFHFNCSFYGKEYILPTKYDGKGCFRAWSIQKYWLICLANWTLFNQKFDTFAIMANRVYHLKACIQWDLHCYLYTKNIFISALFCCGKGILIKNNGFKGCVIRKSKPTLHILRLYKSKECDYHNDSIA